MAWLPDSEKIWMIYLFVLTQLTNVTDTHRHRMTTKAALDASIARQWQVDSYWLHFCYHSQKQVWQTPASNHRE